VVGNVREDCNEQCGVDAILVRRMIQRGCRALDTGAEEVVEEGSHRAAEVRIPRIPSREGADEEAVHHDRLVHALHVDVRHEDGERRSDLAPNGILAVHPQLARFHDRLVRPQRLLLHFGSFGIYCLQSLPDCAQVAYLRLLPRRNQFWSPLWASRPFHVVLLL
jgi:hypothetical protein